MKTENWLRDAKDYVIASDPMGRVAIYKSNTTVSLLVQTATSLTLLAVTYADAVREKREKMKDEK